MGYTTQIDGNEIYTMKQEPSTEVDATNPDGSLGFYGSENITRIVIELKDAKTPLDKKQVGRENKLTPVEQGFSYVNKYDRCDWVIVSNFSEIRLYHKDRGMGFYEKFEILELNNEKEFERFYFCLCAGNLIDKNRQSKLDVLAKDTSKSEEDISKAFYKDFKELRLKLFKHICENNSSINKKCLLEKTQKLLDRMVFIFFCEDTNNLLPCNIVKQVYELGIKSRERSDQRVWREFKNFLQDIDEGRHDVTPPINAYNGGLFAFDEQLDNLAIRDEVWADIVKISDYDFESDLNVNILGHIFEQSISDIEQLKSEIEGTEQDKAKSKRKKDGIFYTPEYITRYIVEQTVGKYLEENPDKLETIKILDPACGSGAFLNQAHAFLNKQWAIKVEENLKNAEKDQLNLFKHINKAENDRSILLNNIFGVDLNEESVEITKLALWLKTAHKDYPLQDLSNNIKCGNSLIDDPEIADNKAFNWGDEYKSVMDDGGFDVIIGNPPYGASLNDKDKEFCKNNYSDSTVRTLNTYNFFISKAHRLLKAGGYFAYIVPNTILYQYEDMKIRELMLKNFSICRIINFGDSIFEEADVPTCVFVLKKEVSEERDFSYGYADLRNLRKDAAIDNIESYVQNQDISIIRNNETLMFGIGAKTSGLINKLNKDACRIDDLATDVSYGVCTGGNAIFRVNSNFILSNGIEQGVLKATTVGEEINRYFVKDTDYKLIYTTKNINITKYPNTLKHLETHMDKLASKRETKKGTLPYWCVWWARDKSLFEGEKIILRQTGDSIIASYDASSSYPLDNVMCIKLNDDVNYLYILTLLNSKLMDYVYKNLSQEQGRAFAQVKPNNIRKLPIAQATPKQQESLAKKADEMITLNKQLYEKTTDNINYIKSKFSIEKVSQKLEKYYLLGGNQFLEEMKKAKVALEMKQEQELLKWFEETKSELTTINNKIQTLDAKTDKEVYALYNLTPEEITIIEGR